LTISFREITAVAREPTGFSKFAKKVDTSDPAPRRGRYDLVAPIHEEGVGNKNKPLDVVFSKVRECVFEFNFVAEVVNLDLLIEGVSCRLDLPLVAHQHPRFSDLQGRPKSCSSEQAVVLARSALIPFRLTADLCLLCCRPVGSSFSPSSVRQDPEQP
jgi:hypothetical protein